MEALNDEKKYAVTMFLKGMGDESIIAYLTKNEHSETEAQEFVTELHRSDLRAAFEAKRVEEDSKDDNGLLYGFLWFGAGAAITFFTYNAGGSSYVIAYGPMVYGVIRMITALIKR